MLFLVMNAARSANVTPYSIPRKANNSIVSTVFRQDAKCFN
jgi:hypothetical protein